MARLLEILLRLLTNVWFALAALLLSLAALYAVEQAVHNMPFVAVILATVTAIVFLVTRKPYLSLYSGIALVMATTIVSVVKYRLKGFDLHVYDFVFTGSDKTAIAFLFNEYRAITGSVLALLAAGLALLVFVGWNEKAVRTQWPLRAALLGAAIAALAPTYPLSAGEPRYFHYVGGFDASAFFVSFLDLQYLVEETALASRLKALPVQPALPDTVECGDPAKLPDIFFVLSESGTNPAYFPQIAPLPELAPAFRSDDGKTRELTVEVFGGGTWISNLSVMTGLSSADFGFQGPYLTQVLEHRVKGALPDILRRCGYHTVAQLPLAYSFVNEGPFLKSIGFETVLDYADIGATRYAERDEFYFKAAERFVQKQRASDGRPIFLALETMFPHSPYGDKLAEAEGMAARPLSDNPELDEYLKRLTMAKQDYQAFLGRLEKNHSERGAVVLEYGDHHPYVTKPFDDAIAGGNALMDLRSIAYRTEYTVHSFGHPLDMSAFGSGAIDIGFLGAAMLQAAGLPTSPLYRELASLNRHCEGRFHQCADREAVDRHLKRRVQSGLLSLQ